MINLHLPETVLLKPSLTVFGVGGAGTNAVNRMINEGLEGVKFVVANTDAQALSQSSAQIRIQLGENLTRGLGAGALPEIGRAAAEEAIEDILEQLSGANMVFITAGMGGGTGTGAAPVIARAARENGILTVGVVTKPFNFEGRHRMKLADQGLEELQSYVDTLIVIPNQNLFRIANEKTTFADAFKMADNVLHAGVRGVTDLMIMPGLINLDFADVRSVMGEMGKAMMGTGEATGEGRAVAAAEAAISNPLLDNCSMKGAKGVLINITGGADMTLFEVDEAANRIRDEVDPDANIIFGSAFNPELDGMLRVSVVATGIESDEPKKTTSFGAKPLSREQVESKYGNLTNVAADRMNKPRSEEVRKTSFDFDEFVSATRNKTAYNIPKATETRDIVETVQDEIDQFVEPAPEPVFESPKIEIAAEFEETFNFEEMEAQAEAKTAKKKGFFGKISDSMFSKPDQEPVQTKQQDFDEEEYSVPAFLRRKKKTDA